MTEERPETTSWDSAELVAEQGLSASADASGVRMGSGTAWAITMQVVGTVSSLILGIMVSRALGPEGKGTLALVQGGIGTLLVLADLGISTSAVYFISKGEIKAGTVLGNALALLALVSVISAGIVAMLFRSSIAVVHVSWELTGWAYVLFVTSIALSWLQAIAVGVRGMRTQAISGLAARTVTMLVVIAVWIFGSRSVELIVAASVIGSVVGLAQVGWTIRRELHPIAMSRAAFSRMAAYSGKLYAGSAADFLHFRQDVLMLGWMVGPSAVGVYSVGVSLGEIATRVPTAVANAIQAQLSRVEHDSALDVAARVMRLCAAFALVSIAALALVAGWLVPAVFGSAFSGSVTVFYLLSPGILAAALIWPISSYQSARGVVYWRESIASGVLNVALNLVLIPRWGYLGATVASSISYVVWFGLLFWHLCRDTQMRPSAFLVLTSEDVRITLDSARSYLHRG